MFVLSYLLFLINVEEEYFVLIFFFLFFVNKFYIFPLLDQNYDLNKFNLLKSKCRLNLQKRKQYSRTKTQTIFYSNALCMMLVIVFLLSFLVYFFVYKQGLLPSLNFEGGEGILCDASCGQTLHVRKTRMGV